MNDFTSFLLLSEEISHFQASNHRLADITQPFFELLRIRLVDEQKFSLIIHIKKVDLNVSFKLPNHDRTLS